MPIIANNIIINGQKEENIAPPDPVTPLEQVSLVAKTKYDKHHGVLFVDGKEKKISKHSQYLLDMLTLDQE